MPKVLHAPALLKRERTEGRKRREKFYIYSDGTHTHLSHTTF
jgi:hypothetical protein